MDILIKLCKCPSRSQAPKVNWTMARGFNLCGSELQHLSPNQQCAAETVYQCFDFGIQGIAAINCTFYTKYCGKVPEMLEECEKTKNQKDCYRALHGRRCNKEKNL